MNMIDRYIQAVKQHLPQDAREDIAKELESNIKDMLPDDYTDEDIYQVLKNLGSPLKLANEYNRRKRYLIGPGYYEKYLSTLKLVISICIPIFMGIALLVWIQESPADWYGAENIAQLFANIIASGFEAALQGAFWVTLVFTLLERGGVEAGYIPFFNKEWTPDDLPAIPADRKRKISRGETAVSMFLTILFTALIYLQPQLIAIYTPGTHNSVKVAPLFDMDRLKLYIPMIIILAVIQIAMSVWKLISENWTMPLSIMNAAYNTALCILAVIMTSDNSLINADFTLQAANLVNTSVLITSTWINNIKHVFVIVFIGICICDSIVRLVRIRNRS